MVNVRTVPVHFMDRYTHIKGPNGWAGVGVKCGPSESRDYRYIFENLMVLNAFWPKKDLVKYSS